MSAQPDFCPGVTNDVFTAKIVSLLAGKELGRLCLARQCTTADPAPICAGKRHWGNEWYSDRSDRTCAYNAFRARAAPPVLETLHILGWTLSSYSILIGRRVKSLEIVGFCYDVDPAVLPAILAVEHLTLNWYGDVRNEHPLYRWLAEMTFPNLRALVIMADMPETWLRPRDSTQGACAFPALQKLSCLRFSTVLAVLRYCPERPLQFWDAVDIRRMRREELEQSLEPHAARLPVCAMGPAMRANIGGFIEVLHDDTVIFPTGSLVKSVCENLFGRAEKAKSAHIWNDRYDFLLHVATLYRDMVSARSWKWLVRYLRGGVLRTSDLALIAAILLTTRTKYDGFEDDIETVLVDADEEVACLRQLRFAELALIDWHDPHLAWKWIVAEPRRIRALLDNPHTWVYLFKRLGYPRVLEELEPSYFAQQCGVRGTFAVPDIPIHGTDVLWLHKRGCHDMCHQCYAQMMMKQLRKGVEADIESDAAQMSDIQEFEKAHPEIFA